MATINSTNNVGFPDLVQIQPFATPISSVGTWALVTDANTIKNGAIDNTGSTAINDEITFNVTLGPGTWTFDQISAENDNLAIIHLEVDGTEVGTIDWYAATLTRNVTKSITGISIEAGGVKDITMKAASKNASATDYYASFILIQFRRTGA